MCFNNPRVQRITNKTTIQPSFLFEIALSLIDGIGPVKAKTLIKHCGSAEAVFTERKSILTKIPEIGLHAVRALNNNSVFERAEKELEFISKNKVQVHYYENDNFPRRLLHCNDHPIILYSKGKLNPNPSKVLSIVGTRRATPYGKEITQNIIKGLKDSGVLICSGLAYGIDAEAHSASIKHGLQTIGTIAHGLNTIYPKEHSGLAKQMQDNGGILSEFVSGTIANKENFPRRNRIVAGMSDATLVVESKRRGGALITAYQASGYNRDVFAIPGKVTDIHSEGCNLIIQNNIATMVQSSEDITRAMGWEEGVLKTAPQLEIFTDLTAEETQIHEIISEHQSIRRDELATLVTLNAGLVASSLLSLELKGVIKSQPGGVYTL